MNIRDLNDSDYPKINARIAEMVWFRYDKKWTKLINPECVRNACIGRHPTIKVEVLCDTYLMLYQVVTPWYSDKRILEECLLFKMHESNNVPFKKVVAAIKALAIINHCYMVSMGTAMADDRAYSRLLTRCGFTHESSGFTMELPPPSTP